MDVRNTIGWFAFMLGIGCLGGLLVVLVTHFTADGSADAPGGLLFLAMASFLSPVGMAALVSGGIGVVWPTPTPDPGHKWRCLLALGAGLPATVIGNVYGVAL